MSDIPPIRIQLRRTKGWKLPENTVVVSRPTRWGNPFKIGDSAYQAVEAYRDFLDHPIGRTFRAAVITELRGKNLACWCHPDQPCHADVLLEIANG